ncbi:MAG: peptidoglycan-binding domain-containing protein [bacterium]|nr:peptidoglycan-binding domain-containing protein [bacterium]
MKSVPLAFPFLLLITLFAAPMVHAEGPPDVCPYSWLRPLKVGATGQDVMKLQQFLNASAETAVALSGAGSSGMESTTFGPRTAKAVVKFQEKYADDILTPNGLSAGTGIVGPSTRAMLNSLCVAPNASQNTFTSPMTQLASAAAAVPVSDTLTVSDPGQPEPSLAPQGAGVLFLSFTLEAGSTDVVVREVVIERTGIGADGAFANFGLWDEQGLQIGNVVSLNSTHRATFRRSFTVPAGSKQTLEVYANMNADLSSYDGQTPVIQLASISASSPVEGTLPLKGTPQTLNSSLAIGGATAIRSSYDPGTALTRYINETGVKFSGIRVTANSQEDITFTSIIWTQSGTAGRYDIDNVQTVVDGAMYPTFVSPYSEKEYVTLLDPGIVVKKGDSIDVYVQGDIKTTGSNRTVQFDIRDINDELGFDGNLYGFGLGVSPSGNTDVEGAHSAFITSDGTTDGDTGSPFYAGSIITISGGAFTTIGK